MTHTGTGDAARTTDEQFLELLCSDEDLLRAEFDAIIAAQWPGRPPPGPPRGAGDGRRPRRARLRGRPGIQALPGPPRAPGAGGWTRQRSPPAP